MIIIGVDYHPSFEQSAFVDTETGDYGEQRLGHPDEAETFYRGLAGHGKKVRVGMEASGHARWFERLLEERPGTSAKWTTASWCWLSRLANSWSSLLIC